GTLAAATASGALDFGSGIHSIASLARGHATNGFNAIALNSCYLECSGVLDAAGMTISANAGACHIEGLGTGTVQNVDTATAIHCHDMTEGAGNGAGLTFDTHVSPAGINALAASAA
ncbi:MAG: hypothetical protein ABIH03_04335, partial [Pseudomonadota bacterium]